MRKEAQLLLQDIVTGELIPAYGKVIKEYISRGEAAPRVYKEQFNRIVKRLYRRHRRDIQALGYGSVAKFARMAGFKLGQCGAGLHRFSVKAQIPKNKKLPKTEGKMAVCK
jgi:hypothetical protein